MPHPFTREQALQNRAFLRELRRTGNVKMAARTVGVRHPTMYYRRYRHPAFRLAWDAALAVAAARLNKEGRRWSRGAPSASVAAAATVRSGDLDPVIVRRKNGKAQLVAAHPNALSTSVRQAFLSALSATANVRLSASAAGMSAASAYRLRSVDPAFAREMRLALEQGYERLQLALLASASPASHEDDAWRHNDPPDMPPMTVNQALQLLYLHQKEARLLAEPPHLKRRKGESREAHSFRLGAMYEAQMEREREKFEVAEAARRARGEMGLHEAWRATAALPDLGQASGWSKADPAKAAHDPGRALFGGWRIDDMKKKRR